MADKRRKHPTYDPDAEVTAVVAGHVGVIELNRPKALNSLNVEMIRLIREAVDKWVDDDWIQFIVIKSSSDRAFCAGGDVRYVRMRDMKRMYRFGDSFFEEEYDLNERLSRVNKPVIALLEGIVMGGGMGISMHGSHRVITPRTLGAMPEAAIGFVPDVGMSYRLTHLDCSPAVGLFIATTGWRLSPADMLYTGLATNLVADVHAFESDLHSGDLPEALRSNALDPQKLEEPTSMLQKHADWIERTFAEGSWTDIEARIVRDEGSVSDAELAQFITKVTDSLKGANPESLVATVELFRRAEGATLREALDMEFKVGGELRRGPNFIEGVRAVLEHKDHNAQFEPASTDDVDVEKWRALLG